MSYSIVDEKHFSELFKTESDMLCASVKEALVEKDASYRQASKAEVEEYIQHYLGLLKENRIIRNFEENQEAWNSGWSENLNIVKDEGVSVDSLRPKYFRGSKFLRLDKEIVVSENPQIEYTLFTAARKHIFQKYLSNVDSIYELGCGSCQNLWLLSELFPDKQVHGFDWAEPSVKITEEIAKERPNVSGSILNFLNPPKKLDISENSGFITIHALEQIGENHGELLKMILEAKPSIVVNYEPIYEFYEDDNVYDYLAKWYSEKRNYLRGYWPAVKALANEGKAEIIDSYRPKLGGVLHEASLIVWRPL